MKETLLVKHAVSGRVFFDTRQAAVSYELAPQDEGWQFAVRTSRDDNVEELLRCREELNVFIFTEYEDAPTLKTWYYVKDGPVHYDETAGQLIIRAHSRIEYYPHEYSHQ